MATGFSPKPRGGWIISTTFPNRRQASTMSPDCSSVYSSPGGAPQCDWMESRSPFGRSEKKRRYAASGTLAGAARS